MAKKSVSVLITGGHVTPALAVIDQFKDSKVKVLFVGRRSTDVYGSTSQEKRLVAPIVDEYVEIDPPKFHRKPLSKNLQEVGRVYSSLVNSSRLLRQYQPDIVLSFGGYVALPIVLAATLQKIPVITHEQTSVMGIANRMVSIMAQKTLIAWPKTKYAPNSAEVIGNPIRETMLHETKKPGWLPLQQDKPLLYITGGNQGSLAINTYIIDNLPTIVDTYQIIHQTGASRNQADYTRAKAAKDQLPNELKSNYLPRTWIETDELGWIMQHADLVVSRAGANTITELIEYQKMAIVIPLPVSGGGEQRKNAQLYADLGLGLVLQESDLDQLGTLMIDLPKFQPNTKQIQTLQKTNRQAAQKLATIVVQCANAHVKSLSNAG